MIASNDSVEIAAETSAEVASAEEAATAEEAAIAEEAGAEADLSAARLAGAAASSLRSFGGIWYELHLPNGRLLRCAYDMTDRAADFFWPATLSAAVAVCAALIAADTSATSRSSPEGVQPLSSLGFLSTRDMTEAQRRGKRIYQTGQSDSGTPIQAVVNDDGVSVPASVVPCANCHGKSGSARGEGGIVPSDLRWNELSKPYELTQDSGRSRVPYTGVLLRRAVTQGVDSSGNKLHPVMPRYGMAEQDLVDLIAYLQLLGREYEPGVNATTIRLGLLQPGGGPMAEAGREAEIALRAYFDVVNANGGIYQRRVEVVGVPVPHPPPNSAQVRTLVEQRDIFAVAGAVAIGLESVLDDVARAASLPVVGALTLYPKRSAPPNPYVFYLVGGVAEQACALAKFALQSADENTRRAVILHADSPMLEEAAATLKREARRDGFVLVMHRSLPAGENPAALSHELARLGAGSLFFLGPADILNALLHAAHKASWRPRVYIPGALGGDALFGVPKSFMDRLFVSFPMLPGDVSAQAAADYAQIAVKHRLHSEHRAAHMMTLASGKLMLRVLQSAGRDLRRERVIELLEQTRGLSTGLLPALTFDANRHIGAFGAHVVPVDLRKKAYGAGATWVDL